jgi:hypothetical protein
VYFATLPVTALSQTRASWSARPLSTWTSRAFSQVLSCPPWNQRGSSGCALSSTRCQGLRQRIACAASLQKLSGSFSERSNVSW